MCWDILFIVMEMEHKEWKRHCAKEWGAGGETFIFTVPKSVPLKIECQRVVSHVFSTAINGSVNWNWTATMARMVRVLEIKIMRLTLRPQLLPDGEWITYWARAVRVIRAKWKEMGLASLADLCAEKIWKSTSWVGYDGTVPVMKALRTVIEWRTTAWWRTRSAKGRRNMGYTYG